MLDKARIRDTIDIIERYLDKCHECSNSLSTFEKYCNVYHQDELDLIGYWNDKLRDIELQEYS